MVPKTMREVLFQREHRSHSGQNKMSSSIRVKYFWPEIEGDIKKTVEACLACQKHGQSQRGSPTGRPSSMLAAQYKARE